VSQLTATIERYHVWGTHRHELRVMHRGRVVSWYEGLTHVLAIVQDDPTQARDVGWLVSTDVHACRLHAKRQGFTHVRFAGDWSKRTKPKDGKL
jgi:hypothetical protein